MFVPLRIISCYSFLKSGLTIDKIVKSVATHKYVGAAISDSSYLYGAPSFIKEMKKAGKKPLIGLEANIDGIILVLYAINENGYKKLIHISSSISKDEFNPSYLKDNHQGLIGVLETNYSELSYDLKCSKRIASLSELVDKFYLGIEINNESGIEKANEIRKFANEHTYNVVAFPRILYQKKEEAIILKILDAIDKGEKIEEKKESGEQYFKSIEAYESLYNKDELDNTVKILNASTFELFVKRGELIHYPVANSIDTLKRNIFDGMKAKGINDQKHIDRIKKELDTIISMGYADYFLIVSDYVKWAKSNGILVGPGRGSAAGSLVSYCLDITEVDPLKYDLQFERFLNRARKTMPDIDVDFMDIGREKVIDYMREKYGADHVANIVTFQTIQAKQALRDIGRIYDIPTRHIDLLSKSITDKEATLRSAYKTLPTFKSLVDSDPYFLEIVSLASKIEGLPRQAGLHAAGIVLNEKKLDDALPVTIDLDEHYTSQFEKDYLEELGFLKMDFLGLTNLTIIDHCLKLINKRHNKNLSFYDLPYEDKHIFELISKLQTIGVFQLESSGMKNAIKLISPKEFNDVVVLLSIYRPGPMDNIKNYVDRKNGKIEVKYLSEDINNILSPTYGVLIYQEQINSLAHVMAGFTPEAADLFRRAVSHKEKSVLESSKKDFVNGSVKKGYKEADAIKMFNAILKFANYGFNKSHAVVYAIIACRMAWLKYYYPLEFYASILSISSGSSDAKFGDYVSEIKSRNYSVLLPNINKSGKEFLIAEEGLLYPLNMIRGVNVDVVEKILDLRIENGEFKDFFDFVSKCYSKGISEIVINKLINSGALDVFGIGRATLRATLKYAYQLAELSIDANGQLILDETLNNQKQYFKDVDDPLINLNLEYEELGIMLSDNPLRYKKDLLDKNHVVPLPDVKNQTDYINIAGIVSNVKIIKTRKNGSSMAFVKLFDEVGEMEVIVFSRVYEKVFSILEKNKILLVRGRYEEKDEKETFIADSVSLLEE